MRAPRQPQPTPLPSPSFHFITSLVTDELVPITYHNPQDLEGFTYSFNFGAMYGYLNEYLKMFRSMPGDIVGEIAKSVNDVQGRSDRKQRARFSALLGIVHTLAVFPHEYAVVQLRRYLSTFPPGEKFHIDPEFLGADGQKNIVKLREMGPSA